MATVRVTSRLPHPVVLRTDEMVEGPLGIETAKKTDEFEMRSGENDVDESLWRTWLETHKDGDMAKSFEVEKTETKGEN